MHLRHQMAGALQATGDSLSWLESMHANNSSGRAHNLQQRQATTLPLTCAAATGSGQGRFQAGWSRSPPLQTKRGGAC